MMALKATDASPMTDNNVFLSESEAQNPLYYRWTLPEYHLGDVEMKQSSSLDLPKSSKRWFV